MSLVKSVKLSYAAYAFGIGAAAVSWLLFLAGWLIYWQVDAGLPAVPWLGISQTIARESSVMIGLSSVGLLLGFALAIPGRAETTVSANSHRSFLLRLAPIAVLCVILLPLAEGRMGAFDADVISLMVVLWCGWLLITGWRALARDTKVSAPFGWQLALAIDVVALGLFAWILCCFRMTRLI